MPRVFVSNQFASFVARVTPPAGAQPGLSMATLTARVIGAGTVYLAQSRLALEDVDGSGVPRSGQSLSNIDPVLVIPFFSGSLWARSTVGPSLEVEFNIWNYQGPYFT